MRTRLAMRAFEATLHERKACPWLNEMTDEELDAVWYGATELVREALAVRRLRRLRAAAQPAPEPPRSGVHYLMDEERRERIKEWLSCRMEPRFGRGEGDE